ncbi:MAG: sporulation protein [Candidatus Fermentibacteraceae bacterium]
MSFFGKIKQGLGIGTASVELDVPPFFRKDDENITGKVTITAKSHQKVKSVIVRMSETYTTGRGDDKKVKEYKLGEVVLFEKIPFELKEAEVREVEFSLPFSMKPSSNQAMAQKDGVLGALGKAAVFASSEKSDYRIIASVDLEGVALDPTDTKTIRPE